MIPTPAQLLERLDDWRPRPIVVCGDFMLDRTSFGHADRLSPDAPVPVLAVQRTHDQPGGAANVCLDLATLGAHVRCLGVIGDDQPGRVMRQHLADAGCDVSRLIALPDRPTTVKHSLVGLAQHRHPQKMFRMDVEDRNPLPRQHVQDILKQAQDCLDDAAVLCLEDYNKGVLTPELCRGLIDLAHQHSVPVYVDPAAIDNYDRYADADLITPNRFEAWLAVDRRGGHDSVEQIADIARQLQRQCRFKTVIITADKSGLVLVDQQADALHIPTRARSVYDVTGAGDMILAMLAAAASSGADWPTAAALANIAAGLEVEKPGVTPIPIDEILLAVLQQQHEQLGKSRNLDQLLPELNAHRAQGRTIAFTNGCFDILHAGHVAFLRDARKQGDLLVVGLNTDASIKRLKGDNRPVNHQADRVMVLSELESVSYVLLFDDDTPETLIQAIKPNVLIKGADYTKEQVVGADIVEAHGGRVHLVPLVEGRSTTNIIQRMTSHKR